MEKLITLKASWKTFYNQGKSKNGESKYIVSVNLGDYDPKVPNKTNIGYFHKGVFTATERYAQYIKNLECEDDFAIMIEEIARIALSGEKVQTSFTTTYSPKLSEAYYNIIKCEEDYSEKELRKDFQEALLGFTNDSEDPA